MTTKNGIGVVIGRFQAATLHSGHLKVLEAANEHQNLLILVGVCPSLGTKNDPLDFLSRKVMLQERFFDALILPLPNQSSDEAWVDLIDESISVCFPLRPATLYFGRGSAVEHYTPTGSNSVEYVDEVDGVSGEERRARTKGEVGHSNDWRAGVIYSVHNQYPQVTPVVDVCITRVNKDDSKDFVQVLVGKRDNEEGHRFPGGIVNLDDPTYEAAARREAYEETNGCETANYRVLGSLNVKSRYNAADRAMMTTVFRCDYVFGQVKGTDDLDALKWVRVSDLSLITWADSHARIARMLQDDVEKDK